MSMEEVCPKNDGLPHVWGGVKATGDGTNPCVFCGAPGRLEQQRDVKNVGHFARATAAQTFTFPLDTKMPMTFGTGDPKKAWPDGMPPEMQARAAAIVEDKKRRDAEAVANGTARPGQVAGAPKGKRS